MNLGISISRCLNKPNANYHKFIDIAVNELNIVHLIYLGYQERKREIVRERKSKRNCVNSGSMECKSLICFNFIEIWNSSFAFVFNQLENNYDNYKKTKLIKKANKLRKILKKKCCESYLKCTSWYRYRYFRLICHICFQLPTICTIIAIVNWSNL